MSSDTKKFIFGRVYDKNQNSTKVERVKRGDFIAPLKVVSEKPDVFGFHDYREFLRKWFDFAFAEKKLSMRAVCQQAGLSHTLVSQVLAHRKNLTDKAFAKLSPQLKLTEKEAEFLNCLRVIADNTHHKRKIEALERIHSMREYQQGHPVEFDTYEYLNNWLHVVIREMVVYPQLVWDAKWIQENLAFPVQLEQIKSAMEFLIERGFVKIDGNKVELSQKDLYCRDGIYQMALKAFYHHMLALAGEAVDRFERENRGQRSYTFSLSKEDFAEVLKVISEAKDKLVEIERRQTRQDSVYHVSFSAFPLAIRRE